MKIATAQVQLARIDTPRIHPTTRPLRKGAAKTKIAGGQRVDSDVEWPGRQKLRGKKVRKKRSKVRNKENVHKRLAALSVRTHFLGVVTGGA